MNKYVMGLLTVICLSVPVAVNVSAQGSSEPQLRDDAPATHTVVKGDTLWDISGTFLKNPWMWPEIWHVNTQIENPHLIYPGDLIRLTYLDGQPRLTLDTSGRIYKLEPKAHVLSAGEAIDTIPLDKINSFLSRSRVVSPEELLMAPYVVSGADEHLISGKGDQVYIRGSVSDDFTVYGVYRQAEQFVDPITKEKLGVLARDIGSGELIRKADEGGISTLEMTRSTEEVRAGDRLLRQEERPIESVFYPSPPVGDVDGVILAVEGGVNQVGKLDVVVLNRGSRELMSVGNVLAVYKRGGRIRDRVVGGWVDLPDERAGLVMVFRVFEKVSLAFVLEADKGLTVNDKVTNP